MNTIASISTSSVNFYGVIADYALASTPRSDFAKTLSAKAQAQQATVQKGSKSGLVRQVSTGRSDVFYVNPYLIQIMPDFNSRDMADQDNLDHIHDLAGQIAKDGVLTPLRVFVPKNSTTMFVVEGHCRLLATFMAIEVFGATMTVEKVPVLQVAGYSDEEMLVSQATMNNSKRLKPLEYGHLFAKLRRLGKSMTEIAVLVGWVEGVSREGTFTPGRVSNLVQMYEQTTSEMKAMIKEGLVTASLAVEVLRESGHDTDAATKTLKQAVVEAKKEGKKAATKRHVTAVRTTGPVAPSFKTLMREILAATSTVMTTTGKTSNIKLSTTDLDRIKAALKIA